LIKWLRKLQSTLEKHPSLRLPEPSLIAKRLSQCLDPSLPHGLHSITLQVYDTIFAQKLASPDSLDHTFALFAAGIIPFFPKASIDIKAEIVTLIQKHLVLIADQLDFVMPGVVPALLSEIDETSSQEITRLVISLINEFTFRNGKAVHYAIWQSLIKNPKVRQGGIRYLSVYLDSPGRDDLFELLPQSSIVMNALLGCLEDSNILVKRSILDFIISYFPLQTNFFAQNEKVALVEAVLYIMIKKDPTLQRRVWELALGPELQATPQKIRLLLELLTSALVKIFESMGGKNKDILVCLDIVDELLTKDIFNDILIENISIHILIYAEEQQNHKLFPTEILARCINILGVNSKAVWKALYCFLLENITVQSQQAVTLTTFYLTTFPADKSELIHVVPIMGILLEKLIEMKNEELIPALELGLVISNRLYSMGHITIDQPIFHLHKFFITICSGPVDPMVLKKAAILCFEMERYLTSDTDFEWFTPLIQLTSSEPTTALAAIDCITIVLKSQDKAYLKLQQRVRNQRSLCESIMKKLWSLMDTPHAKKAVETSIKVHAVLPHVFLDTLASSLVVGSVADKVSNIRKFLSFWKICSEHFTDKLSELFESGEGIFNMLDHLDDEKPLIRHSSREWLLQAMPQLPCLLDPIVDLLVQPISYPDQRGDLIYLQLFDSRRILNSLKKLRSIMLSAGDELIKNAANRGLGIKYKNEYEYQNYLELLLHLTLKAITTEPVDELPSDFKEDCRSIQAAACEFVELILDRSSPVLAYQAVQPLLFSIKRSYENGDNVMQLLVLEVLNVIFFRCKISQVSDLFIELIHSQIFLSVISSAFNTEDIYLRNHWIKMISGLMPVLVENLDPENLTKLLSNLIKSICNLMEINAERAHLFQGLTMILQCALISLKKKLQSAPAPASPSKPNLISGVFRIFSSASETQKTAQNEFACVYSALIRKLKMILMTCIRCSNYTEGFNVTRAGAEPFWSIRDYGRTDSDEIIILLKPVGEYIPRDFIETSINLWQEIFEDSLVLENKDQILQIHLRILISLNITPLQLVSSAKHYLQTYLIALKTSPKSKISDVRVSIVFHYLYSFLAHISYEKFSNASNDELKECWMESMKIVSLVDKHMSPEICIWLLELLHIFTIRFTLREAVVDKKFRKELQELTARLINEVVACSISSKENYIQPLAPSIYSQFDMSLPIPDVSISQAALVTLKHTLFPLSVLMWSSELEEKLINQIYLNVLPIQAALITTVSSLHPISCSDLFSSLLLSGGAIMAKLLRKDLIEFLFSDDFFGKMSESPECLRNWCSIYNGIVVNCYPDRLSLVNEILNKVSTGMFVSKSSEMNQRAKTLKCISFLIYSGARDEYQACSDILCERVIDYLRTYEGTLVYGILLLLRVALIRFSPESLNEFWPRVWPHAITEIMSIFNERPSANQKLSALKLLEELSVLDQREFLLYQWMFFYDVFDISLEPEGEHVGYWPMIPKIFMSNYAAKVRYEVDGVQSVGENVSRGLIITQQEASDYEELESKARTLIQYVLYHNVERSIPDIKAIEQVVESDFLLCYIPIG
jgi:hypothetical protein